MKEQELKNLQLNTNTTLENENVEDKKYLFSFAKFDETKSEHLASQPYSYIKSVLKAFINRPAAILGIALLIIFLLYIIIIPEILPDVSLIDSSVKYDVNQGPSLKHLFGTDKVGRDLFYAIWIGARKSTWLAVISSVIVLSVGIIFGMIWGFFRKLDWLFIEIYNLVTNIPSLLIYMLLSIVFVKNLPNVPVEVRLILSLTMTSWLGTAMFLRNQILIISDREYNIASKTLGTPARRIMTKNLLPFLVAIIVTSSMTIIPGMVSGEVTLSYFGLGLPSDTISIGAMLKFGLSTFQENPWALIVPGGVLAFMIMTFYLIGIALADALDPRTHR